MIPLPRWFFPHLKLPIHQVVPEGGRVQGELGFSGGLLIQGQVRGALAPAPDLPATVTVGASGLLEVERLEADTVVIHGQVRAGLVKARHLVLGSTARVEGDIQAQAVEIHTGAQLTGRVASSGGGQAPAGRWRGWRTALLPGVPAGA